MGKNVHLCKRNESSTKSSFFQYLQNLSSMKLPMISLSRLNKLIFFVFVCIVLISNNGFAEDETIDIWEQQEIQNEKSNENDNEKDITIESQILSEDVNKIVIKIK